MIYAILADGFEEIEAICVIDILRRAQIEIKTVSIGSTNIVKGAHGISVISDLLIKDINNDYDMIFLPGGYPGYVNLKQSKEVADMLHFANNNGKKIAVICAAPSVLGGEGLLTDKDACCFPGFEDELNCKNVLYDDVVCSGNIITSRGAGTAHKLGFKLVEILSGCQKADELRKTMVYTNE